MKEKSKKQIKPKTNHQNGKGSSPRNLSEQFKKNYEQINWNKKKGNK